MPSEPAASARPDVAVRFMLDADPDPGLLPRLLQPFAKRDLVPDRMWSHRNRGTVSCRDRAEGDAGRHRPSDRGQSAPGGWRARRDTATFRQIRHAA